VGNNRTPVAKNAAISEILGDCHGLLSGNRSAWRRRTIMSAGAIGSPHILQLSGVGDPEHLGITVTVYLSPRSREKSVSDE
jgi:hypothetical protein